MSTIEPQLPIDLDKPIDEMTIEEKRAVLEAAAEINCSFAKHAERMLENLEEES